MGVGPMGGFTVAFGIKAVADLRGVDQTEKALAGLSKQGAAVGTGIDAGMQQAATGLKQTGVEADQLAAKLDRVSTVGFAVGAAIFAGLGIAIKGASDLAETVDKATRAFGENFQDIDAFAEDAAQTMGMSRREALDATSAFGMLFNAIGAGDDEVVTMSKNLTQLASGIGSVFNVASAEAQQALLSGLAGESEPLRRFNIFLTEAKVAAELAASGQKQVNGEWTEAQKILARYTIIMREGEPAFTNFIDTQTSAANATKTATSELKDASDALGTLFLPAVSKAATAISAIANAFNDLPTSVQNAAGIGLAIAGGLALVVAAGAKLIAIGTTLAPVWGRVAGSFTATGIAAGRATAGMAGLGTAATASTGAVAGLSAAQGGLAASSVAARTASSALVGTLGNLAKFGVISIGIIVAFDAITNAPSGRATLMETVGTSIAGGIADQIRAVGGVMIADAIDDTIDDAERTIAGRDVLLDLGFKLEQRKGKLDQFVEDVVGGIIPGGSLFGDKFIPDLQHADDEIAGMGVTVSELQAQADAAGIGFGEMLIKQAQALGITTPELEAYLAAEKALAETEKLVTEQTEEQTLSLQERADALIENKKAQDELNKQVRLTENVTFLAGQAAKGLFLPFTRDADDAEKATADFNRTLEDTIDAALDVARGIEDIAPSLAGLQVGFGKAGGSVTDMVRAMDDLGILDLSPAMREALDFSSALVKVEADIERVSAAITNNEQDLAMWQGRISLVADTFGINTESLNLMLEQLENGDRSQANFNANIAAMAEAGWFPKLDALLMRGKISQEEYNAAVEAGVHIIQRSAGALSDEEAEQVRNIIALDALITKHDEADGAVKEMTESQRALAAAMADTTVQQQLQTLELLTSLALMGQIDPERVTEFIVDASAANDTVAIVFEQLGLIKDGVAVPIDVDEAGANAAIGSLEDIEAAITDLETAAGTAGTTIGNAISGGVAGGFADAKTAAATGTTDLVGAVNGLWNPLFNSGYNGGYFYGIGVARGIASQWNDVFNAAFNLGIAADAGTKAGMQAASPSRLAIDAGRNWTMSLAASIRAGAGDVERAGEDVSRALAGTIAEPTTSAALRGVLMVDRRATDVLAAGMLAPSSSSQTVNAGGVTINVSGAGDPEAVAQRVYRSLDAAFGRLELETRR